MLWCCDVMKLCLFKLVLLYSQKSLLSYVNYKCTFYSFFFIYEKKNPMLWLWKTGVIKILPAVLKANTHKHWKHYNNKGWKQPNWKKKKQNNNNLLINDSSVKILCLSWENTEVTVKMYSNRWFTLSPKTSAFTQFIFASMFYCVSYY